MSANEISCFTAKSTLSLLLEKVGKYDFFAEKSDSRDAKGERDVRREGREDQDRLRMPLKCAHKTTLAFYLFLFSDGLRALRRTVRIKYNKYQDFSLSLSLLIVSDLLIKRQIIVRWSSTPFPQRNRPNDRKLLRTRLRSCKSVQSVASKLTSGLSIFLYRVYDKCSPREKRILRDERLQWLRASLSLSSFSPDRVTK